MNFERLLLGQFAAKIICPGLDRGGGIAEKLDKPAAAKLLPNGFRLRTSLALHIAVGGQMDGEGLTEVVRLAM